MKKPFDAVTELALKAVQRNRERFKDAYDISDKFTLWISGFSIAAISLIISNTVNLQVTFSEEELNAIMAFLLTSTVLGIISRYLFGFLYVYDDRLVFALESRFIHNEMMSFNSDELPIETPFFEIISRLKLDFGDDLDTFIERYNQNSEKEKERLRKELLEYYNKKAIWATEAYQHSLDFVKDSFSQVLGISRKKVDKQWDKKLPNKRYRLIYTSIQVIVPLHIITFLIAIFITVLCAF